MMEGKYISLWGIYEDHKFMGLPSTVQEVFSLYVHRVPSSNAILAMKVLTTLS
jgi:hypothetical protein